MQLGDLNIPKIEIESFSFIHNFETRVYVQFADLVEKTEVGRAVVKALTEDPRVIALTGKMITCGGGARRFEIKTLAMWFLWHANEHGLEKAKRDLNSFLSSKEVTVVNSLWVVGIEVEQPIFLRDEYIIQPANQMPDSGDKEYFLQRKIGHVIRRAPVPLCAITKPCRIQKAWSGDDPPLTTDKDHDFLKVSRRLYEIALLLNVLNGISCVPYYSTSYGASATPFGPFGGSGGGWQDYDVLAIRSAKLPSDSQALIDSLLAKYEELNDAERTRIQRVLNRLSQAKRRGQIEDKILDLGITLEMLLLEDNRNNDQLSLSFRLRGSWLLGKSAEDRVEKHRQLKEIYVYRSQVAHSGVLCNGKAKEIKRVQQSFDQYQHLAEDICKKIIMEGKPDWRKLVLGAI